MNKEAEIFLVMSPFHLREWDQRQQAAEQVNTHSKVAEAESYASLNPITDSSPTQAHASGWGDLGKASKSLDSSAFLS